MESNEGHTRHMAAVLAAHRYGVAAIHSYLSQAQGDG